VLYISQAHGLDLAFAHVQDWLSPWCRPVILRWHDGSSQVHETFWVKGSLHIRSQTPLYTNARLDSDLALWHLAGSKLGTPRLQRS
jgi:hypothetical protein